jgi:S-DNA-T family DNA segregation ATPase FtsK/SpoIIIE
MAEKKKQAKKTTDPKKKNATKKASQGEALKKRQRNRNIINALTPWVLGIVAVYLVVCYVVKYAAPDHMELIGFVGREIVNITLGLFGIGGFLIPVYLFNIAFSYKDAIDSNTIGSKVTFNVLNLVFISMLVHLLTAGRMTASLGELFEGAMIKDLYSLGASLQSGGFFGGMLCEMVGMLLGSVGAMIVCVVFAFVTLVFLFGITPSDVFRWIYDRYKENSAIREEEKRLRLEEYEKRKKEEEKL